MNYYMTVYNRRTERIERKRIHGRNMLQLLQYARRLGLAASVSKAKNPYVLSENLYTIGADGRLTKWFPA